MKKLFVPVLLLLVFILLVTAGPVLARSLSYQVENPPVDAGGAIQLAGLLFASLVNIPGCIAALGNILKKFKILSDGAAPAYNLWFNVIIYLGVFVLVLTGKTSVLAPVEAAFAGVNTLLVDILALLGSGIVSMGLTGRYHALLKDAKVPLLGYSHSA